MAKTSGSYVATYVVLIFIKNLLECGLFDHNKKRYSVSTSVSVMIVVFELSSEKPLRLEKKRLSRKTPASIKVC